MLCIVVVGFSFAVNAQKGNFNAGINLGLPTGDASDLYSFVLGLEANYLFDVTDAIQIGPSVSFVNYFGDNIDIIGGVNVDVKDISFLPIAAAVRFNASEKFVLGADIGYGIGVSPSGNDGGFYYRPLVGYNISEKVMLQLSYSGISINGGEASNIGLGAMYGF